MSLVLGVLTTQTYAQAVMSGKSDRAAGTGALISAVLIPPIGAGGILVGLFMRSQFPDMVAKNALTAFAMNYLPPVLCGLLLGTLFVAVVGTGAGLAMGISTIIRRDILQRYSDRMTDVKLNQFLSKIIIIALLAGAVVLSSGSLGDMILSFGFMSMGLRGAVVFVPMTCALWMPGRINKKCVMFSNIASPITVLVFGTFAKMPLGLDPLFAGIAVALAGCTVGRIVGNRTNSIRLVHSRISYAGEKSAYPVIVIDSENCSGSEEIASALAEKLQMACHSEDILQRASEVSGISEKILKRYEDRPVVAAYDLMAEDEKDLRLPTTGEIIFAQRDACRSYAKEGPCVLLDHFASCALKEENVVRIFMYADFEYRSARYAKENGLGAAAARKKLKKLDHMHDAYYRNGNRRWGYAGNYMIMIDTTNGDPKELSEDLVERIRSITKYDPGVRRAS